MAHIDYICTECGEETTRELLTVRKIVFLEMGMGGRTVRSRVAGWLCPKCTANDFDWNREPFTPPNLQTFPKHPRTKKVAV